VGGVKQEAASADTDKQPNIPLGDLLRRPQFIVAAVCTSTSYTAMASLMSATPARMVNVGFTIAVGADIVRYHVIAMYVPCLVTGDVIKALGAPLVIVLGYVQMAMGILCYALGSSYGLFLGAMLLLGTGWNFAFLGSSALLTSAFPPTELPRVQGVNDACSSALLSVGVATSSIILEDASWTVLVWTHAALTLLGLATVASFSGARAACGLGAKARSGGDEGGDAKPQPAGLVGVDPPGSGRGGSALAG